MGFDVAIWLIIDNYAVCFYHILIFGYQKGVPKRIKKSLIYIGLLVPGPGEKREADPCPGQGRGNGTEEGRGIMSSA